MEVSIDLIKLGCAIGLTTIMLGVILIFFNSSKLRVQGYVDDMIDVVANLSDGELALYNNKEVTGLDAVQLIKDHAMSGIEIPTENLADRLDPYYAYTTGTGSDKKTTYYEKDGIPIYLNTDPASSLDSIDISNCVLITRANADIYDKTSTLYISEYNKFYSILKTDENVSDTLTTIDSVDYIVFSQIITEPNSETRFALDEESESESESD